MNYNTLAYFIYIPILAFITLVVGKLCHKNGIHFITSILDDEKLSITINNLLLIGYYLVNIGYVFISLINWNEITNSTKLIEELSIRSSYIILLLTVLHYLNITSLFILNKRKKNKK